MLFDEIDLLVFDTETTGTSINEDRIVEIGGIYFRHGVESEGWRVRIKPERPIPPEASKIHGILDETVRHEPAFAHAAPKFLGHLEGSQLEGAQLLAGFNAMSFDVPLLNVELVRACLSPSIDPTRVLDPLIFIRWHLRHLRDRSLEAICEHYDISLLNSHSTQGDASATGRLVFRLIAEGIIPAEVETALQEQARLSQRLQQEWQRFSYWLYSDRKSGRLRLGCGRHYGSAVDEVDLGYLDSLLRMPSIPQEVRNLFAGERGARAQQAQMEVEAEEEQRQLEEMEAEAEEEQRRLEEMEAEAEEEQRQLEEMEAEAEEEQRQWRDQLSDGLQIAAQFSGICGHCRRRVVPGETIFWAKGRGILSCSSCSR